MTIAIIYRSLEFDIVLLDIPTSIQEAQKSTWRIRSTAPISQSWPSTEPKGAKLAKALATINPETLAYDQDLQSQISASLKQLRRHVEAKDLPWCFPRCLITADERECDTQTMQKANPTVPVSVHQCLISDVPPMILSPTSSGNTFKDTNILQGLMVVNPSTSSLEISASEMRWIIPPASRFIWSMIVEGMLAFEAAVAVMKGKFDLILMDPPWTNRSVRKKNAYTTTEFQQADPFNQTLPIIEGYLADQGTVAIWITNKPAIRSQVDDTFQTLGLRLHEEWIWIKITSLGEPVTELSGVWRKPYEILLIYRRIARIASIQRKFIFAVPDVHSRKPVLKSLFEESLPSTCKALELFARSLTSGWWSWGDEVLKFQQAEHWAESEKAEKGASVVL